MSVNRIFRVSLRPSIVFVHTMPDTAKNFVIVEFATSLPSLSPPSSPPSLSPSLPSSKRVRVHRRLTALPAEARLELARLNAGRVALAAQFREAKARVWEQPDCAEARRALGELAAARAAGGGALTLMRAEKLRLFDCADADAATDTGTDAGARSAAGGGSPALLRRLRHAAADAEADGYFNLRAGPHHPTLQPPAMDAVLQAFASAPRSVHLGLTGNAALGDGGAAAVAAAIAGGAAAVEGLYMSHCGVGPAGAAALAGALRHRRDGPVVRLGLNFNRLGDGGAALFAPVLAGADACSSLRVLGLSGNGLGDAAAIALAAALGSNTTLRRVYFTDNAITCAGAGRFGELLLRGTRLHRLGLAHNRIGPAGAASLAAGAAAAGPGGLERLCLFGNPFLESEHRLHCPGSSEKLGLLSNVNLRESKV